MITQQTRFDISQFLYGIVLGSATNILVYRGYMFYESQLLWGLVQLFVLSTTLQYLRDKIGDDLGLFFIGFVSSQTILLSQIANTFNDADAMK